MDRLRNTESVVYDCSVCFILDVEFDGLFVSNGPGNPEMCYETVKNLAVLLHQDALKPVFGICLGHQLIALAASCKTYKMK